jgi:hypothetical protein
MRHVIRLALVLSVLSPLSAAAQQPIPGDACSPDGNFVSSAGPEITGAGHLMVCQGGTWKSVLSFDSSANATIANALGLTGDITPAQITANQNDYNPSGLATASVLRLSSDVARNITGLAGGTDGRVISIHNVGTSNIVLKNQDAASTAANRFAFGTDITIAADQSVAVIYDATSQRWRAAGLPFDSGGGAPNCTDDSTATCTLDADRDSGDPQFTAANIADGVNILGVTGTLAAGGGSATPNCLKSAVLDVSSVWDANSYGLTAKTLPAGTFIFGANPNPNSTASSSVDVEAFTFDGSTMTNVAGFPLPAGGTQCGDLVWSDGAYVYVSDTGTRIYALSFNGTAFAHIATYNATTAIEDIWGDGTYIYLALGAAGVRAMTFDGASWTPGATYDTPGTAYRLAGNGGYIFVADQTSGVRALTYNGTWTSVAAYTSKEAWELGVSSTNNVFVKGSQWASDIYVLSFNGTAFSLQTNTWNDGVSKKKILAEGNYVYFGSAEGSSVYEYDGSNFTMVGAFPNGSETIASDGNYLYGLAWYGPISALPFCSSGGGTDTTPSAFSFPNKFNAALSTLTTSSAVKITGISTATNVGIAGGGNPQYRVCANSSCSSVLQDWTSGGATIENNEYLQLRLTSSASEATQVSATVTVGSVNDQWDVTTLNSSCSGVWVGGACWFLGALNQSCDTACTAQGKVYHAAGQSYADNPNVSNCQDVLDALSAVGSGAPSTSACSYGCAARPSNSTRRLCTSATTSSATNASYQRACACN